MHCTVQHCTDCTALHQQFISITITFPFLNQSLFYLSVHKFYIMFFFLFHSLSKFISPLKTKKKFQTSFNFFCCEIVFSYVCFMYTFLHCVVLKFRTVQCSTVQTVYCTNFKSTPLICTKLQNWLFFLCKKNN